MKPTDLFIRHAVRMACVNTELHQGEVEAAAIGMSTRYVYEQAALPAERRDVRLVRVIPEVMARNHPYTVWKECQT
ncbi:hypothetical protein [Paenibacillus piri]|uniref:Uncharacterized protein n=1 Tax=Paenibacillus piri TaxID=2547395 RepID=A0A4R5KJ49_9BACL|nr:hypothetical protein [Paenibacillus piri]TDF94467.1 hypothetical protein E1757_23970 [Paenibacillus piri]